MFLRPFICAAVPTLLLLGACRDREITAYRAPKDPVPAAAPGGDPMAGTAVPTGGDSLTWTAPTHWIAQPASAMRKGSYAIRDGAAEADLSITAFPGDTGGLLANLNRWRGQISLPPLAPNELDAQREHADIGALPVDIVDFAGTVNGVPTRLLGAVVPFAGETWFFKLMGPDALVAREKPVFREFLRTLAPR